MRQPEDQLRALIAASSDAVYRMSPDWTEMRQLDGRAFIADTLETSADWRDRYIHPDDRAQVDAAIAQALRSRTTFELEHRVVRTDGTLGWTFSRAVPLFDANGELEEWVGMASDVTRRKEAEHKLRDSEARFRSLGQRLEVALRAGKMGTWELDLRRQELRSSDTCKANYGRKPHESFTYQELAGSVLEDHRARWQAVVERAIADAGEFDVEYPVRWPDDSRHWVHVRGRCTLEDGVPVAMAGVSFDITARRQAEEELADAARRKDEFLATLAHELRNPLAPLRTGMSVLRLQGASEGNDAVLGTMERQLTHMVRLVDDLLDLSRVSRGKVELRRERIDVRTVIEHAVEASRPAIDAGQHVLTSTLPGEPIWVDGDLTRLVQVLGNVLTNAARYTNPRGRISLSAERSGREAVLRVRDSGIGIAPHMLESVFEMFAQGGGPGSHGGLGIGLALARHLVSMHGGSIGAHSDGPGQGAEFTIRLPVELAAPEPLPVVASARLVKGRRILVVDDNADAAEMLAVLLSILGHSTQVAHDGPDALRVARAMQPEVVFLDLGLPGMSGYEVAQAFRADAQLRDTRLLALTGWGSSEDRQRSRAAGFDVHLTKPVGIDDVESTLARLFTR